MGWMVNKRRLLFLPLLFALFVLNKSTPSMLPGEILVENDENNSATQTGEHESQDDPLLFVSDRIITLQELEYRTDLASWASRQRTKNAEGREEFMANLLRIEVFAQVAQQQGLRSFPFVDLLITDTIARAVLIEEGRQGITIQDLSEEELAMSLPTILERPALRRGNVIVFQDEAEARQIHERLLNKRTLALTTPERSFEEIQQVICERQNSSVMREICVQNGELGWITDNNPAINSVIREALFALEEIDDLSEPFQTERGWEIVMLTSIRASREWDSFALRSHYETRALYNHEINVQNELLTNWRNNVDILLEEHAIETLIAARRQINPNSEESSRVRRFERDGLASDIEMILGEKVLQELQIPSFYDTLYSPFVSQNSQE